MTDDMKRYSGRVLLVDDDMLVAMNERDYLERTGYTTDHAACLRQAKSLLKKQTYNLIILDHDLPDGKGASMVKWLNEQGFIIPIIYASAAPPKILQEVGKLPGVRAVLTKPVDEKQLVELVHRNMPEVEDGVYPRLINSDERDLLLSLLKI